MMSDVNMNRYVSDYEGLFIRCIYVPWPGAYNYILHNNIITKNVLSVIKLNNATPELSPNPNISALIQYNGKGTWSIQWLLGERFSACDELELTRGFEKNIKMYIKIMSLISFYYCLYSFLFQYTNVSIAMQPITFQSFLLNLFFLHLEPKSTGVVLL